MATKGNKYFSLKYDKEDEKRTHFRKNLISIMIRKS